MRFTEQLLIVLWEQALEVDLPSQNLLKFLNQNHLFQVALAVVRDLVLLSLRQKQALVTRRWKGTATHSIF